jgi:hypothetical protein
MRIRQGFSRMHSKTARAVLFSSFVFLIIILPVRAEAFCFEEAGKVNNISSELLKSIARVESGLNSRAVNTNRNGSTDLGLMQINSAWVDAMSLNREELISNPCYNVMTGANILRQCIDKHGYTWEAVGCYNAKSKGKRVGYSWKIFRELKKEKARKIAKDKSSLPETVSSGQSLYFRVRDEEKPVTNGEP